MTDHWNEQLWCSLCHQRGMANLSHFKGAETPTVDRVTCGFKAVQTQYGPDLYCHACNIPVGH